MASKTKKDKEPPAAPRPTIEKPVYVRNYPYVSTPPYDEKKVMKQIRCGPQRHDYFGFIYSSKSQRPPGYFKNYFLPVYGQPNRRQHVHIIAPPVPSDKIVRDVSNTLMPLSTVKVQWRVKRNATVYRLEDIYNYFSKFGLVEAVYPWRINSALVVFSQLTTARQVVNFDPDLGSPWDILVTSWFEPRLNNWEFYRKYAEIEAIQQETAVGAQNEAQR